MKTSDQGTLALLRTANVRKREKQESDPQERWEKRQRLMKEGRL